MAPMKYLLLLVAAFVLLSTVNAKYSEVSVDFHHIEMGMDVENVDKCFEREGEPGCYYKKGDTLRVNVCIQGYNGIDERYLCFCTDIAPAKELSNIEGIEHQENTINKRSGTYDEYRIKGEVSGFSNLGGTAMRKAGRCRCDNETILLKYEENREVCYGADFVLKDIDGYSDMIKEEAAEVRTKYVIRNSAEFDEFPVDSTWTVDYMRILLYPIECFTNDDCEGGVCEKGELPLDNRCVVKEPTPVVIAEVPPPEPVEPEPVEPEPIEVIEEPEPPEETPEVEEEAKVELKTTPETEEPTPTGQAISVQPSVQAGDNSMLYLIIGALAMGLVGVVAYVMGGRKK